MLKGTQFSVIPATLALAFFLTGCASTYQPVVDTKGIDMMRYQQDLAECRALAEQVNVAGDAATDTAIGAGVGAAGGAALGALSGDAGIGAATGAIIGAFGGGGVGTAGGIERQKKIINNCLIGRGYKVLG